MVAAADAATPCWGTVHQGVRVRTHNRRGQWRPGGWQNGRRGRSGRSGLQCAASLSVGKKILDFMTLAIQSLAVMDWFLAAVTGWDARRDALLGQHLTDFVATSPFILSPITVAAGGRSLSTTSAPVKLLHFPSCRWSRRGPPLLLQTPWSLLVMPLLVPPIRRGALPLC